MSDRHHPGEESLVLYLVGDAEDRRRVEAHLERCSPCQRRAERVEAVLERAASVPVPDPGPDFEERIWARQRRALHSRAAAGEEGALEQAVVEEERAPDGDGRVPRAAFWNPRRLALGGAVAAGLLIAFLAGLFLGGPGRAGPEADAVEGTGKVLLVAVGDHLERARMVLVELSNVEDLEGFRAQRANAQELLGDNRLFRQTAQLSGREGVAEVLAEIERVLLDVARSSEDVPPRELEWLRRRISEGDLLFKMSVIEGSARRGGAIPPAAEPEV